MKNMHNILDRRVLLKNKFRNRERMFGVGYLMLIPQSQRLSPSQDSILLRSTWSIPPFHSNRANELLLLVKVKVFCLPRPVSHSNDYFKPLLDSGADGLLVQMVNTAEEVENIIADIKYPPVGRRTYGVNRAQSYGFHFDEYIEKWNQSSMLILQIETIQAVDNIEKLLEFEEVDGVMIGPYDMSGSLGVPGETSHPKVIDASRTVIETCKRLKRVVVLKWLMQLLKVFNLYLILVTLMRFLDQIFSSCGNGLNKCVD